MLQVFWCHPLTVAADRGTDKLQEEYYTLLDVFQEEVRCPEGWRPLNDRVEKLAFTSFDGRQQLRCIDDTYFPFSARTDEKRVLRRQDLYSGWHPNAIHFQWTPFSQDPVPFETIREFARAIRECYLLQSTTRGDIDIRFLSVQSGSSFPPKTASAHLDLRVLAEVTAAAAADADSDEDADEQQQQQQHASWLQDRLEGSQLAKGWQTTAASVEQLDPYFLHVIVADPDEVGGGHGTHTFAQIMERDCGAHYVYLPYLGAMGSALDVSVHMRRAPVHTAQTVVLRTRVHFPAHAQKEEEGDEAGLTLPELVAFLQAWKDAAEEEEEKKKKRVILILRGRVPEAELDALVKDHGARMLVWALVERGFESPIKEYFQFRASKLGGFTTTIKSMIFRR